MGHTRQEFDYPIPVDEARALLALCVGGLIDKRRHWCATPGTWEVDEFLGDNAGLVVAEVELDAPTSRSSCRTGPAPKSPSSALLQPRAGLAAVFTMDARRAARTPDPARLRPHVWG
jgi:hypothetical protein